MTFRGAIISVGGSDRPVITSLRQHQPEAVLFFVSPDSRKEVEEKILPVLDRTPQYSFVETPNPGDLAICYEALRTRIPEWLSDRSLQPQEVLVDITGATKPMSAALALAGVERFTQFSYVTGRERDKAGLGVVIPGTEYVVFTSNPWDKLATRERERSTWLFGNGYAEEAAELLHGAAVKCSGEFQQELETLAKLAGCFAQVDRFDFSRAAHTYGKYRDNLKLILSHRRRLDVREDLEKTAEHWQKLRNENVAGGADVTATLRELLANAERRAKQGRYDDATARLYRATELFGQGKLWEAFQAKLGNVRRDQIPQQYFNDWVRTFGESEVYKLGVRDAFKALAFGLTPEHRAVAARYDSINNHLQKRNNSILAHGLQPCATDAFTGFWEALLPVLEVNDEEIPRWPKIEF